MAPQVDWLAAPDRFPSQGGTFEEYIGTPPQMQTEPYAHAYREDREQDEVCYIPDNEPRFASNPDFEAHAPWPPGRYAYSPPRTHEPNSPPRQQYIEQYAQLLRFTSPKAEQYDRMELQPQTPPLKGEPESPPYLQLERQVSLQRNERESARRNQREPPQKQRERPSPPQNQRESSPPQQKKKWVGFTNVAGQQHTLQGARLSQLYAALHRHYMLSCPVELLESGARVLVSWLWEPTAQQGVADIHFKGAAEVASELAELRRGTVDDHRSNEGGILHLIGNPDLFWSAILHWAMHGTCMPLTYADLGFTAPRPPQRPRTEVGSPAGPRIRRVNESLSRSSRQSLESEGESTTSNPNRIPSPDLPSGWQDVRRAWDKAFDRASRVGYIVHCMFYCTEMGCAAGDTCSLRHDDRRRQWCRDSAALERARRARAPRSADAVATARWEDAAAAAPPRYPRAFEGQLRRSWPDQQGPPSSDQVYVLSERM